MSEVGEATERLLSERRDMEGVLRAILTIDGKQDTWQFEDIPADSGEFGELVESGIVVKEGDGYRLAERDTVRRCLANESEAPNQEDDAGFRFNKFPRHWVPVTAALALVVLMRIYVFPLVFRKGDVFLFGNDAYFVRFSLDRLVTGTGTLLNPGPALTAASDQDSLLLALLWVASELLGGTVKIAGVLLAWYPVVAAVITATVVYVLAVRLTNDWRIGIASIVILAVLPMHAYRTALGFADHHAFDYVWVILLATALVALAQHEPTSRRSRKPWLAGTAVGLALAGYSLAWLGSPIVTFALALYVGGLTLSLSRTDRSPAVVNAPLIVGFGLALTLVGLAGLALGWADNGRILTLSALLAGTVGVTGIAEAATRRKVSGRWLLPVLGVTTAAILAAVSQIPGLAGYLQAGIAYFQRSGGFQIAETTPILGRNIFLSPLLTFGILVVPAIVVMAWATWQVYTAHRPAWLVPVVFGWYLFGLAWFVQRRFAGELSLFFALFAGAGFVALAAYVDITQPPDLFGEGQRPPSSLRNSLPNRRRFGQYAVLFVMFAGLNLVQTGVYIGYVTPNPEKHDAARWMDEYEDQHDWEFPENYVLSPWSDNRLYNYFVSGDERHPDNLWYGYARDNYRDFLNSTQPNEWYERFQEHGLGFVVVSDIYPERRAASTQRRLFDHYGSASHTTAGVGHYRAVYASSDGSLKVFTAVPGAKLSGTAEVNATVRLSTPVSVPGASFTYERRSRTDRHGNWSVIVPYPGRYDVDATSVRVTEAAIANGTRVIVGS